MGAPRWQADEFHKKMMDHVAVELPGLDDIIAYIRDNMSPDDVFAEHALENWAEKNGYSKPE